MDVVRWPSKTRGPGRRRSLTSQCPIQSHEGASFAELPYGGSCSVLDEGVLLWLASTVPPSKESFHSRFASQFTLLRIDMEMWWPATQPIGKRRIER